MPCCYIMVLTLMYYKEWLVGHLDSLKVVADENISPEYSHSTFHLSYVSSGNILTLPLSGEMALYVLQLSNIDINDSMFIVDMTPC